MGEQVDSFSFLEEWEDTLSVGVLQVYMAKMSCKWHIPNSAQTGISRTKNVILMGLQDDTDE